MDSIDLLICSPYLAHSCVLGTCTSQPTVLSLSKGYNIKQKLEISCGLNHVLSGKHLFEFFFFPQQLYSLCLVSHASLHTKSYFPVASVLELILADPAEKEAHFLLSQSSFQSVPPRQMRADSRTAHVSVGVCLVCTAQRAAPVR